MIIVSNGIKSFVKPKVKSQEFMFKVNNIMSSVDDLGKKKDN